MSLRRDDIARVGRTDAGDVNGRSFRPRPGEMGVAGRLGVKTPRRQRSRLILARLATVSEMPEACDHRRGSRITVRMGSDVRARRNVDRNGVETGPRGIALEQA